jgi:hypothetical protein
MNDAQSIDTARNSSAGSTGRLVRLDRRFVLLSLLAALLFSWPLVVFGSPSYIQDSAAYYKGGRAAVSYALAKLNGSEEVTASSAAPAEAAGSPAPPPGQPPKEISGVRSITYSVAAYLLSAPSGRPLLLLAIVQALAAGAISVAALGVFGGLPARRTTVALILLAATTTVALVSGLVIPDIFAGLLIATMVLLTVAQHRLSVGVRLLCAGIAVFAVTAHSSHFPVAVGMTILGLVWVAFRALRSDPLPRWTWAWVVAPLVIGGFTILALNRIAFGETSLASKRYPFALARSVDDGPARWYLEKHCRELRFAICTVYPHGLPAGGALEFLWGPDGVTKRATPAQLDRIRAEEPEIVLAAAHEYPWFEARTLAYNIGRQLVLFRPYPFTERMVLDRAGMPQLVPAPRPDREILSVVSILNAISAAIGTAWLAWAFLRKRSLRPVIALVFLGVLGNAVTCVVLSSVAHRYQARVVWLIPLFALALYGSTLAGDRSAVKRRPTR